MFARRYEVEFFFMLWLMLPFTDGATLCFDMYAGSMGKQRASEMMHES